MDGDLFAPKRKSVSCCVTPCLAPRAPDRSFHSFPSEADVREKWLEALSVGEVTEGMKVCGGHFTDEDFFPNCAFKVRKLNVKRLKRTAVPSLYLPSALQEGNPVNIVKIEPTAFCPDSKDNVDDSTTDDSKVDCSPSDECDLAGVKTEPASSKDQYAIETFCCTTCGLISNSEGPFLEHLGTHVKCEYQNFIFESEVDPLSTGVPDDSDYQMKGDDDAASADTFSAEATLTAGSPGGTLSSDEIKDEDLEEDKSHGPSIQEDDEEGDIEFLKFLASDHKFLMSLVRDEREHLCFLCGRGSRNIRRHFTVFHLQHPAVQDVWRYHPQSAERRRRVRRLILVGDLRAKKRADRVVKEFCTIRDKVAFEEFMRRRLPPLDGRLREFIFGIFYKRLVVKEDLEGFSLFSRRRLYQGDGVPFSHQKYTKCSYCDFCTVNKTLATAHFQLHSGGKKFGCHNCQRYYDSLPSLMSAHTAGPTCSSIRVVNFQFRCDFCWVYFSSRKDYVWHVMLGTCFRWSITFPCGICGEKIVRKQLPSHVKSVHAGEMSKKKKFFKFSSI